MTLASELIVDVRGRDVNATALIDRIEQRLRDGEAAIQRFQAAYGRTGSDRVAIASQRLATEIQKTTVAANRATVEQQRLASEQQRTATASNQAAAAAQRLATEQQRTATATAQAAAAQTRAEAAAFRLAQAQDRAATASQRNASLTRQFADGLKGGLVGLVGPAAAATAVIGGLSVAVGTVVNGFQLSATLDEQRRAVGVFVGDVERGNDIFEAAARFGRQYGYTQREMGSAAAAAAPLIRNSATATEKQLEVLGRLAALNSAEGFEGAVFSTKELASGDITSIVERFNLSRDAAYEMRDAIANGADVFEVLDAKLNEMGVTSDILANRMVGAAGASRTFAQAQEDLSLALGRLAEGPGVAVLDFLSAVTSGFANVTSGEGLFGAQITQATNIEASLVAASTSYEDYQSRVAAAKAQIDTAFANDPIGRVIAQQIASFGELLPSQVAYAQALVQTGTSAADAYAKTQQVTDIAQLLATQLNAVGGAGSETGAVLNSLGGRLLELAASGDQGANTALTLAGSFAAGEITAEQFRIVLEAQVGALNTQAQAAANAAALEEQRRGEQNAGMISTQAATQAYQINTQALVQNTQKTLESSLQTQQLSQFQTVLANLSANVANGLITSANAAAILAQQYNITSGEAARLINLQAQLARTQASAAVGKANEVIGSVGFGAQLKKDREEAAKAEAAYQLVLGNTGPALAEARAELAKTREGTKEYYEALTKVYQLEQQGKPKGGGGAAKLNDQQKLNNTLLNDQARYQDQAEQQARDHAKRLLDIDRDFQERSLEQQRKNEIGKRRGELDYLKAATSSDLNDTSGGAEELARINAQYYADFEAAQAQAQAGNAALSAELVALAGERAKIELDYAEQIAAAKEKRDAAEVARLEALREKERQILDEQQRQILTGGDANVNARNEALTAEQERYEEQQGKGASAAESAADRKIAAAERAGRAIDAETLKLQQQEALLNRLAASPPPGGATTTPSAPTTTTTPNTATAQAGTVPDLATLAESLNTLAGQIAAAITSASGDVVRAQRDTTDAVKSLNGLMR